MTSRVHHESRKLPQADEQPLRSRRVGRSLGGAVLVLALSGALGLLGRAAKEAKSLTDNNMLNHKIHACAYAFGQSTTTPHLATFDQLPPSCQIIADRLTHQSKITETISPASTIIQSRQDTYLLSSEAQIEAAAKVTHAEISDQKRQAFILGGEAAGGALVVSLLTLSALGALRRPEDARV